MFKNLIGWQRYVAIGLAALALVAIIVLGVNSCKDKDREADNTLVNSGIVIEREANQREVINRVEESRDAVERPTDAERNVVCNKYDRNCSSGQ